MSGQNFSLKEHFVLRKTRLTVFNSEVTLSHQKKYGLSYKNVLLQL